MGSITFYTFSKLPPNELWIYHNDDTFVHKIDIDLARLDIQKYLGKMLYEVVEKE